MMKKTMLCVLVVSGLVSVLSISAARADRKDFSAGNLRSALQEKLQNTEQELSGVGDLLEEKSRNLLDLIDKEVDEGFVKLDDFNSDLERQVREFKQGLGSVLNEEKLAQLQEFFENLDQNVIDTIQEELIAKLAARIEVTPEQLEKLAPILRDEFQQRRALLGKYLKMEGNQFEEYQTENDLLWPGTLSRLQDVLRPEQIESVNAWRNELREKIQRVFSEKK